MEAPRCAALPAFSLAIALSVLAAPALSADTKPPEEEITPSTAVARRSIPAIPPWWNSTGLASREIPSRRSLPAIRSLVDSAGTTR